MLTLKKTWTRIIKKAQKTPNETSQILYLAGSQTIK